MKRLFWVVMSASLLVGCSSGTTQPQPQPQPSLNYPYNPPASNTVSSDPRVPYYGDWVWSVGFSDGTTFSGKMSISNKPADTATTRNFGGGPAEWCVSGFFNCPYTYKNLGIIGSVQSNTGTFLSASYIVNVNNLFIKFIAVDADGQISIEPKLNYAPSFIGVGQWYYDAGGSSNVVVIISQLNSNPEIKLQNKNFISTTFMSKNIIENPIGLNSLSTSVARDAAFKHMQQLLNQR